MYPNEREYLVRELMYQDLLKEAEQARTMRNGTPARVKYADRIARLINRFGNQLTRWREQIQQTVALSS